MDSSLAIVERIYSVNGQMFLASFCELYLGLGALLISLVLNLINLLNIFAGIYEFSLLPAFYPLQYTANELAGSTTAAAPAGSELPKSEDSLQWLRNSRE